MIIKDWKSEQDGDTTQVSADVDGFRLWFRAPSEYPLSTAADPFFAAALLPAMATGQSLEVDPGLPLSPTLLKNAEELQEIFHCWNPRQLKLVPMTATTKPTQATNSGALAFFSGGVDSTYTFLKRLEEITHVVFIFGFDFFHEGHRADFDIALRRNSAFAGSFGKTLIPVETNVYPFGYHYNLDRRLSQGGQLGAIALLLGFPRAFIPATVSYNQLYPLGSHPLTDPLWSNECVHIVHDGCEARRVDKLKRIGQSEAALANLQVCADNINANCGKCAKCLRTMMPLKLLGISTQVFPPLPSLRSIRRGMRSAYGVAIVWMRETADIPALEGDRETEALRRALRASIRRIELRQALNQIDAALLRGSLKRMVRRVRNVKRASDDIHRVGARPPEN